MASYDELQLAILSIHGVVGAELTEALNGSPAVRVSTNNSRDEASVHAEVSRLASRLQFHDIATGNNDAAGTERRGVVGGFAAIQSNPELETARAQSAAIDTSTSTQLELISIEESLDGVVVRAVDTAGAAADAKGHAGSVVDDVVVAAVARLIGVTSRPRVVSVNVMDMELASVLVLVVELGDGSAAAGASVVEGWLPFVLGKAAWSALTSALHR